MLFTFIWPIFEFSFDFNSRHMICEDRFFFLMTALDVVQFVSEATFYVLASYMCDALPLLSLRCL